MTSRGSRSGFGRSRRVFTGHPAEPGGAEFAAGHGRGGVGSSGKFLGGSGRAYRRGAATLGSKGPGVAPFVDAAEIGWKMRDRVDRGRDHVTSSRRGTARLGADPGALGPRESERPGRTSRREPSLDRLPDVRDGLTREQRVILTVMHEAQQEWGDRTVPSVVIYGRVVERVSMSVDRFMALLAHLAGQGDPERRF